MNGFTIDGQMDENELNFDNKFCPWDLVTGKAGTFYRVFDLDVSILEDASIFLESWYYDDASPVDLGDKGAPLFLNGFTMCSALTNGQNEAWGTSGLKSNDLLPGIPNTDPLLFQPPSELPPEACETAEKDSLDFLDVTVHQYYLESDFDVEMAQDLSKRAINPMYRKVRC